ncbi:MAG TPA: hypothetical protein VGM98_13330, partial [Schlesneria sp.]
KPAGFYESLGDDKRILGNTAELMKWLATSPESDLDPTDYDTRLRAIGAAVRAATARGIGHPLAVFVTIVRNRDWSKISDDQRTEAKKRLMIWEESRHQRSSPRSSEPVALGDVFRTYANNLGRPEASRRPLESDNSTAALLTESSP